MGEWTTSYWHFSRAYSDPVAIMKTALHLMNITLVWAQYRKCQLHCCFQGNYTNNYPWLSPLSITSLYRTVIVASHSLASLSFPCFLFWSCLIPISQTVGADLLPESLFRTSLHLKLHFCSIETKQSQQHKSQGYTISLWVLRYILTVQLQNTHCPPTDISNNQWQELRTAELTSAFLSHMSESSCKNASPAAAFETLICSILLSNPVLTS